MPRLRLLYCRKPGGEGGGDTFTVHGSVCGSRLSAAEIIDTRLVAKQRHTPSLALTVYHSLLHWIHKIQWPRSTIYMNIPNLWALGNRQSVSRTRYDPRNGRSVLSALHRIIIHTCTAALSKSSHHEYRPPLWIFRTSPSIPIATCPPSPISPNFNFNLPSSAGTEPPPKQPSPTR